MKTNRLISGFYFITGLLITIGPKFLFPVCQGLKDDGTPMRCFYVSNVCIGLGIGVILFAVALWFVTEKHAKIISTMGNIFLSVMSLLTAHLFIGICKTDIMSCKMLTAPALGIVCTISIMVGIIYIFELTKNDEGKK